MNLKFKKYCVKASSVITACTVVMTCHHTNGLTFLPRNYKSTFTAGAEIMEQLKPPYEVHEVLEAFNADLDSFQRYLTQSLGVNKLTKETLSIKDETDAQNIYDIYLNPNHPTADFYQNTVKVKFNHDTPAKRWQVYVTKTQKEIFFGDIFNTAVIDLDELKTNAFATYLHWVVDEQFKGINPVTVLSNRAVGAYLDTWFGDILWINSKVSNTEMKTKTGMNIINDLLPESLANLRKLKATMPQPASTCALQVYYDTASFYEKLKYKVGTTVKKSLTVGGLVAAPVALVKLTNIAVEKLATTLNNIKDAAMNSLILKRNKLINDPVKLKGLIEEIMSNDIVGLKSTISKLTELVLGNLALQKSKGLHNRGLCQLMTFIGPPGTGKSMLAQRFALALTGKPIPSWAYYTSSSFKPGMNPREQLFHPNSELVRHLKANKGQTVIFIDEIDKFDSNSLLESFRDAVDRGTISITSKSEIKMFGIKQDVIESEIIEVPGLIVIVGTNEKPECWGLDADPDEPAYQVGRTEVERSGSITQRFQKFKFDPYTKEEYKQMYENSLDKIKKHSITMFARQLVPAENLEDSLAEESVMRLQGARSVAVVLSEMAGAVASFDSGDDNNSKVYVQFDTSKHEFVISNFDDLMNEDSNDED